MPLTAKDQRLIRLATGIALGNWDEVRRLRHEAPDDEPDRAWREVVLQAHLFAGFPRVVEACEVLSEAGGLGTPEPEEAAPQGDCFDTGRALFERVYDRRAQAVRDTLQAYHPTLERWIEGHAYGRVLGRPGLGADRRELCAVASLAALEQDRQLASHVRGALHCGASAEEVEGALACVRDLLDEEVWRRGLRVMERFLGKPRDGD